jgi:hypothetical protein
MKSRRMRCAGLVAYMGEREAAYRVLLGETEGRRPLGRPRRIWEDNIKTDLKKQDGGVDSINLAEDPDNWRALVKLCVS